jgi:HAD superfamily hydrolase (TIGR01490 family)
MPTLSADTRPVAARPSGNLALFDLDHTLIPFDSGLRWTRFLVGRGFLDAAHEARYLDFCHAYVAGTLDIHAMHRASFEPLLGVPRATLDGWVAAFEREVAAEVPEAARALVRQHQAAGDRCAIVTATDRLVAEPFARIFGVDALIATLPATVDGAAGSPYTGGIEGEPCYRAGKVRRVAAWLAEGADGRQSTLAAFRRAWFYSDSISDLPLLEAVTNPVAVAPDDRLREHAVACGWAVIESLAAV